MSDVVMPRLSESMEEGTILKWLVDPGATVARGQEIVEIETDKATMTYEAEADGPLEIVAAEGDTLRIGTLIGRIGGAGAGANGAAPAVAKAEPPSVVPAAEPGERIKASPLARRIAKERGVDIATLTGTGPSGRVVRADVEAGDTGSPGPLAPPVAAPVASVETGTAKGEVTRVELSRTQQVVARRMAESKATVPEFTLTADTDMTLAVALRAQIKTTGVEPTPSYNDMVVKACALALTEFPRANGAYRDGRFELYGRVNVGVAVAAQDVLVVPTVFDADSRSITDISITTRALAERVRSGAITPPELSGGTFTVSNLGMYGVSSFTAVINAPQAAILAVGAMIARAVPVDGEIVVRQVMPITLVCDHRILYGADAAQFLSRIRALLENPVSLLLGQREQPRGAPR
jgi:pyruvate dehydrogenase E2 component (dihydrolipoamide acetyltransferase)